MTIAPGVEISRQSIGVASNSASSSSFGGFDGILGCVRTPAVHLCIHVNTVSRSIGPRDLTLNTTFPNNSSIIPTVTDNLVEQGTIKQNLVAVYFQPSNITSDINLNGELTFGGTDLNKYTGDISYQ